MFRHEYKKFQQLLRHYYVVKLYCLESLYQYSVDQHSFVNEFETGVHKLPIFQQIHNAHSDTSNIEQKSCFSAESDLKEDSSNRSLFKELAQELRKAVTGRNDTSENSSKYYHQVPSDEPSKLSIEELEQRFLSKLDSESSGNGKRGQCFDIAAQMKGLFCDDDHSSHDLERFRFDERRTV